MTSSPSAVEILALVGPTASGKSALAIQLAKQCGGEIISADSVQIYKHFDIGSGKPTPDELAQVPHHLIGTVEPNAEMDASIFASLADDKIGELRRRQVPIILCGGTFLWIKALLHGLSPAPPKDERIRKKHQDYAALHGRTALHRQLALVDSESAARLNPNDMVRVSRALEVFELSGRPLSEFHAEHRFQTTRYRARLVGIHHTPEQLTTRIQTRVRQMLDQGWEAEVRRLIADGCAQTRPMAAVGYRQVLEHLQGGESLTPGELEEAITRVTRIFARRQRTWLRDQEITWLSAEQTSSIQYSQLVAAVGIDAEPDSDARHQFT